MITPTKVIHLIRVQIGRVIETGIHIVPPLHETEEDQMNVREGDQTKEIPIDTIGIEIPMTKKMMRKGIFELNNNHFATRAQFFCCSFSNYAIDFEIIGAEGS